MTDNAYVGDEAVLWIQRWEDEGGTWRIVAKDAQSVTVGLRRCDGGEEVDRFTAKSAELLARIDDGRIKESWPPVAAASRSTPASVSATTFKASKPM